MNSTLSSASVAQPVLTILDWYFTNLWCPAPNTWVFRVASTFRGLALTIITPVFFLTSLDVASYLIVRTLGADPGQAPAAKLPPPPPIVVVQSEKSSPTDRASTTSLEDDFVRIESKADRRPQQKLEIPPIHFASSSEGNFALSGVGLFSPPESRASSPPVHRNITRSRSGSTSFFGHSSSGESGAPGLDSATETDEDGSPRIRKRTVVAPVAEEE